MKRFVFVFLLVLVFGRAFANFPVGTGISAAQFQAQMNSVVRTNHTGDVNIDGSLTISNKYISPYYEQYIALGDSNTYGYNATSYVTYTESLLPASITIRNQGVSGDQTTNILANIETRLGQYCSPDVNTLCTLMVGVNDFGMAGKTVAETWSDYKNLLDAILTNDCDLVVMTYYGWTTYNTSIKELNDYVAKYSVGKYRILDIFGATVDDDTGEVDSDYVQGDNHLNDTGQRVIGGHVASLVYSGATSLLPILVKGDGVVSVASDKLMVFDEDVVFGRAGVSPYDLDFFFTWDEDSAYTNFTATVVTTNWNTISDSMVLVGTTNTTSRFELLDTKYRVPTNATVGFTVMLDSFASNYATILGTDNPGIDGERWSFYHNSSGQLRFSISSGTATSWGLKTLSTGVWYNVSASFDATMSNITVCVDDTVYNLVNTNGIVAPSTNLRLGMESGSAITTISDANFDNFYWYDRQLSENEQAAMNKSINASLHYDMVK